MLADLELGNGDEAQPRDAAELAKEVRKVNYQVRGPRAHTEVPCRSFSHLSSPPHDTQVAATMLRVTSPGFSGGSKYQIAYLVQWLVRAAEPSMAAEVDAATMREARELVDRVGTDNQREIARLCGRLEGLRRVAESATATVGERDDAEREFAHLQVALLALFGAEEKFKALF